MKGFWSRTPEEIRMLELAVVSIVGVAILISISGVMGIIPYADGFISVGSLFAGIFGIIIGFQLDRISDKNKDFQTKNDFLNLIHEELTEIRKKVYPQTRETYILYTDVWDSAVSSGVIRLLSTEQVGALSKIYKSIKGTSYEAEWVRRDFEELQGLPDDSSSKIPVLIKCIGVRDRHYERMENLSKEIDGILKKGWWNRAQTSSAMAKAMAKN
jgi:hypothetical protein